MHRSYVESRCRAAAHVQAVTSSLDWKPEISTNEGIESVINWYLDNEKIASKINLYF